MKGFIEEFKKFITRGNVLDMAVGVIIGGAFTAIVTSLNTDIISPLLALIGGVASIWLTSGIVSIPAIIGFISLLGIAVRNGILLVSHYRQLQSEGLTLYDAVVQGSIDRLNPILMTSLTSALALIPLALNGDASGNEIQSPMAKVILGGLISSTLLNGFIIPIVYIIYTKYKIRKNNA